MSDTPFKSQNHIRAAAPALLVLFLLVLWVVQPAQAAVTLLYFNATPGDSQVLLEWATATELNNVGFFVVRSGQSNGTYTRASDFIPSEGDSLVGAAYDFTDSGLTNGQTYWYKLESVDINNISSFEGPKSAVPGAPAQATSTATQTATATTAVPDTSTPTATQTIGSGGTATATETQSSGAASTFTPTPSLTSTSTRTPTLTPTRTSVSASQPARTQTPFPTRTSVPDTQSAPATETVIPGGGSISTEGAPASDQAPTATLIPLPTLNLVLSEDTPTPTSEPAASQDQGRSPWATPQRLVPLGFIALIWVILGGWFYFSQRRLG